jgi:serine/threonine protein kinase
MALPRPPPQPQPQPTLTTEEGCFATSPDRKYYRRGNAFIKRCLRPREFLVGPHGIHVPRLRKESLRNEADTLRFIRRHTEIPVPLLFCDFEDDDAYYLITEYVEGVSLADLPDHQKDVVLAELEGHLGRLKTLRSHRLGGPAGVVIPPYRVLCETERDDWTGQLREARRAEYVFCHNDCSQHNIIVNPDTLKIAAIVDWEYAGFYPEYFEFPFYRRKGPSVALGEEEDDTFKLLGFLHSQLVWQVRMAEEDPRAHPLCGLDRRH